jgi:hypothetical protein
VNRVHSTNFCTDHLYLAAYLICCGHPILGTKRSDRRVGFLFAQTPEVASDAAGFMSGGSVEARQFSFEILKLKRLIPRLNTPDPSVEKMKKNENSPERYPARNDSV